MVLEEVKGLPILLEIMVWGQIICIPDFITIWPIVDDILYAVKWTDRQTN